MAKRIFFILFIALVARSAFAMSEAEQDSLYNRFQISEVEVTARSLAKDVIVPQSLKGDELQRMNALSVADALRYFSGVQLKDYGGVGGIKTINIRSMGSQHTAVYYNGVQLGNAQNGQVDLGRFSLDNLEEIQLFNGQKSDIFQSAREFGAAGNVYLTTRKPYFKEDEKVHVHGQMRFGSFSLANPNVGVDVKLTESLSLTLDAEYVYSDGKYPFRYRRVLPSGETAYDTTAVRQNGDVNAVRTELGLHHYYRTTGFWRVHVYNYYSERGVPGAIVNNVWRNGERLWDRNTFVQAQWQDEWFNRWSTRFLAKYANDFTHYQNYDERLLPSNNKYTQQEAYLSFANKFRIFSWWDLSLAYDYQFNALARENLLLEDGADHFARHSHWLSAATAFNVKEYLRAQASVLMTAVSNQQSALQLCDKMAIMQQDGTLCQYGTDEEIILHPANRFTFEFIGVSNFIPLEKVGNTMCLNVGEKIPCPDAVPEEAANGGYEIGVRPNDIVFDPESPLQARVDSRVFLGSEYNYFLSLGSRQIRVQQSMLDARTRGTADEGETVGIRFLNSRCYPAKKEGASA